MKLLALACIALTALGAWLAIKGLAGWTTCGYDCGIFGVNSGISVILAMPGGLLLILIALFSMIALARHGDSVR